MQETSAPALGALPETAAPSAMDLTVAAVLNMAGGFLDAFTYVGHGHVFTNAMTGNVVLLGVYAAERNAQALAHLPPICAFLLGVMAASAIKHPGIVRFIRMPQLAALVFEVLLLVGCGFLPKYFPDEPLVLGIAFAAALQNASFRKLGVWSYNSVITTGNMQQFGQGLFAAFVPPHEPHAGSRAFAFGAICVSFGAGAIFGALLTPSLGNVAVWVPAALLASVTAILFFRRTNLRPA